MQKIDTEARTVLGKMKDFKLVTFTYWQIQWVYLGRKHAVEGKMKHIENLWSIVFNEKNIKNWKL